MKFFTYRNLFRRLTAAVLSLYDYKINVLNITSTNDYKLSYDSEILNHNNP